MSYHAGLSNDTRTRVLNAWTGIPQLPPKETKKDKPPSAEVEPFDIVVATIAFGMGIDKPDGKTWSKNCHICVGTHGLSSPICCTLGHAAIYGSVLSASWKRYVLTNYLSLFFPSNEYF
jgi:hypothetical protein